MKFSFITILCLSCGVAFSQNQLGKLLDQEVDLTLDNDAFYLVNEEDQYYSSGIFASFRTRFGEASGFFKFFNKKERLISLTQGYHFLHLMYTPYDIKYSQVEQLDRPYAGAIAIGSSLSFFNSQNWAIKSQLDFGIMGPATKTGELQEWWHNQWDMKRPRGWEHQINNTPYINLKVEALKSFTIDDWIDVVYESEYEFGTIFNSIQQGGVVRFGLPQPLQRSGYANGLMGLRQNPDSHQLVEWYFFWGLFKEYVIYNATIEGNLIGTPSAYTEEASAWVNRRKAGVNLHWQTFDMGLHFYYNSAETKKSADHRYIRIRLTQRF